MASFMRTKSPDAYNALYDIALSFEESPLIGCTTFAFGPERSPSGGAVLARAFDFEVDDITAAYASLETHNVKTAGAPHLIHTHEATGEQEWMAFFEDPDGRPLALMSQVGAG